MGCLISHRVGAEPRRLLAQGWRDYGTRDRYEALRNYRSYEALPNEHRQQVDKNYERWQAMPPQQRDRIRQNYERYRRLPPEQRNQLRNQYRKQPPH